MFKVTLASLTLAALLLPSPASAIPPCAPDEGAMHSDQGVTCFPWFPLNDVGVAAADCPSVGGAWVTLNGECLPPVDTCEEDESCWDCETMGNGICGPIDLPADLPATA